MFLKPNEHTWLLALRAVVLGGARPCAHGQRGSAVEVTACRPRASMQQLEHIKLTVAQFKVLQKLFCYFL